MNTRMETSPLATFRDHLSRGELAYQIDEETGQAVFYPRLLTSGGSSESLNWRISHGLGTVYATTFVSPRNEAPYNVALIDMDEGFRLMSRVESIAAPEVRIGLRVRVRIHHPPGDEPPYPVFDPLDAA